MHHMQLYLHMVQREYWITLVEQAWQKRSVVWLSGVRRVGKTCLSQSLPDVEYLDCELPRTRRRMEDPEAFLGRLRGRRVVLDEIHRLDNPSQLLKIAADHYPGTRVLATGSSTLSATSKFRDTLSGRKVEIWLTPMMTDDLKAFGRQDLRHRFLNGGLPPFFLAEEVPERDFQEWMDAYWAKDIQELFRLERRHSFQRFCELLLSQSPGIFEASRFARPCEVSRTTIGNYLRVLETTHVVHVLRPFSTHRPTEIVSAPKVYGFDTGFVCYHRGWETLRSEDMGLLWEHFVLNEMHARLQRVRINYWRNKHGREVDFVLTRRGRPEVTAIECKWSAGHFDPRSLRSFRRAYPNGANFVVCADVDGGHDRRFGDLPVHLVGLDELIRALRRL